MINLDEHKIFVENLGMEVIPYSVAKQAVAEAANFQDYQAKLEQAMEIMKNAMTDINKTVEILND
tara:strand:- start:2222 stop:2416 length:195 start_codon:yes stop_codon:yes gene_type:complete